MHALYGFYCLGLLSGLSLVLALPLTDNGSLDHHVSDDEHSTDVKDQIHYLPHENDCQLFYASVGTNVIILSCSEDELFDVDSMSCKGAESVICDHRNRSKWQKRHKGHSSSSSESKEGDDKEASVFCRGKEGHHMHGEYCHMFYSCEKRSKQLHTCPKGKLFDEHHRRCEPRHKVDCGKRIDPDMTPPPGEHFKCPSKREANYPHEKDCGKYYQCEKYKHKHKECEKGKLFDIKKGKCKDEEDVDCGDRIHPSDNPDKEQDRVVDPRPNFKCYKRHGRFEHVHCDWYYHCKDKISSIRECRRGYLYDVKKRECREYRKVICNKRIRPEDRKPSTTTIITTFPTVRTSTTNFETTTVERKSTTNGLESTTARDLTTPSNPDTESTSSKIIETTFHPESTTNGNFESTTFRRTESPQTETQTVQGTTIVEPGSSTHQGTTVVEPGSSTNQGTTVVEPGSSTNQGTTVVEPGSSTHQGTTVVEPGSSTNQGTTVVEPGSSTNHGTTVVEPGSSTHQGTTVVEPGSSTHQGTTVVEPGSSTNQGTTVVEPGSSTNQGTTVVEPGSSTNQGTTVVEPGSSTHQGTTVEQPESTTRMQESTASETISTTISGSSVSETEDTTPRRTTASEPGSTYTNFETVSEPESTSQSSNPTVEETTYVETTPSVTPSSQNPTDSSTFEVSTIIMPTTTEKPFVCENNGHFPYPKDCALYYVCVNKMAILAKCPDGTLFDAVNKRCDHIDNVDCGERGKTGDETTKTVSASTAPSSTPSPATSPVEITTIPPTEATTTTTEATTTTTEATTITTTEPTTTSRPTGPPPTDCSEDDLDCIIDKTGDVSVWFDCKEENENYVHPSSKALFIHCINGKPYARKCASGLEFDPEFMVCVVPFELSKIRWVS